MKKIITGLALVLSFSAFSTGITVNTVFEGIAPDYIGCSLEGSYKRIAFSDAYIKVDRVISDSAIVYEVYEMKTSSLTGFSVKVFVSSCKFVNLYQN